MPFAAPPKLSYIGLGQYELTEDFLYLGRDQYITVPAGFVTDLATSPRVFWALIPPQGSYEAAAVLHDYLCVRLRKHWLYPRTEPASPVSARDADGLFRRVMREQGVGFLTRWAMWAGVRWGALFNKSRRAGWWRDAPDVLGISVIVLTAALFVTATAYRVVGTLLGLVS